jgi:hypothetical protein
MTTTEWVWLIVGIISVLAIGGAVLWGVVSYIARQQREIRAQRRPEYQSPLPAEPAIRWGDELGEEQLSPPLPTQSLPLPAEPLTRWENGPLHEEQPLPASSVQPVPLPAEPIIRWGHTPRYEGEVPPATQGADSIQWGEEREYTEVSPVGNEASIDEESVNCPICRQKVDETTNQIIKCPKCETLYHQHCLADMDRKCRICGLELN